MNFPSPCKSGANGRPNRGRCPGSRPWQVSPAEYARLASGRLNLDSEILNPELFRRLGPDASDASAKARLRDRIDAGIAHEYEEVQGGGHEYAYEHAPDTELPIRHQARELARKIRDGERRRRG